MRGEFHIHSNYSDGSLEIEEILEILKGNLDFFCITDHDELEGSIKASQICKNYGLKSLIGLELSTYNNGETIHILGYFPDNIDIKRIEKLINITKDIRIKRINRLQKMKKLLFDFFDIDLDITDLLKKSSITRGSISREIIKQGYPYTLEEIFEKFIGEGKPAYIPSNNLSTKDGINIIKSCGGLAVLAHPTLLKHNDVEEIIKFGVDGIEAVYPLNKEGEETFFRKLALKYDLVVTAGNDFHFLGDTRHGTLLQLGLYDDDLIKFINKVYENKENKNEC